ncbi:hypothetical protein G6F37_008118 [Rhizopus arrhizus]|nr:hypothetical protein G6F38_008190 [Rhizopus arrhizus]KAG1155896.1 hypothetical protein G6F37_008118 [Rhizopus arrhizus]
MTIDSTSNRTEQLASLNGLQGTAGRRNASIGPRTNREMLFGLMNHAFVWKAVNAVSECLERKEIVMMKEAWYLQSSEGGGVAMVCGRFWGGDFRRLEMIDTGSADQGI